MVYAPRHNEGVAGSNPVLCANYGEDMAHRTKNKGPGWIGAKNVHQHWFRLRVKRSRVRNEIAKLSRRANRKANQ